MTNLNRRHLIAFVGTAAVVPVIARAQDHGAHHGSTPAATPGCHMVDGTPQVVPFESDIPFDQAYIDTMIPHHTSVIDLATTAMDVLEDERLVTIAQAILDSQPGEIEELKALRLEFYGSAEPEELSHEMMMVTMGDTETMAACGDHDMGMGMDMDMMDMNMALMDSEALLAEFEKAENKDLGFIDLVIPHHQMAVHQSWVGLQLAEHKELRELCQEVIDAQEAEIKELEEIRKDIA